MNLGSLTISGERATAPAVRPGKGFLKGWTHSKMAVVLLLAYLGIIATEGFSRWILTSIGAESLIYLRDLLPPAGAFFALRGHRNPRRWLLFVVIGVQLFLASAVGYYFSGNVAQVFFGLRMFIPLLFGIAMYSAIVKNWQFFTRGCLVLLGIAVIAVVINQYVHFPWIGADFSLFNITVELSREWMEFGGRERLPGFSRASYDAATQIVVFYIITLYYVRGTILRTALTAASLYAVYLTTSKAPLLAAILLAVNFLLIEMLPQIPLVRARQKILRRMGILLLRLQIAMITAIGVLMPLRTSGTLSFLERDLREQSEFHLLSMQDRAATFWPLTMEHIVNVGNPWLGVGMGGIGSPLDLFGHVDSSVPGDNSFLYFYALFGVIAGLYFFLFACVAFSRRLMTSAGTTVFGLLALSACVQGVTKTTIEGSYDCLFLGLVIAHVTFGWRSLMVRRNVRASENVKGGMPGLALLPRSAY